MLKTFRRILLIILSLVLCPKAFGADTQKDNEFYIGIDGGYIVKNDEQNINFKMADVNFGVKTNDYLAFETGYFKSSEKKRHASASNSNFQSLDAYNRINFEGIYSEAIGILPLTDTFSAQLGIGAAFVNLDSDINVIGVTNNGSTLSTGKLTVENHSTIAPRVEAGLEYEISQHLSLRTRANYMYFDNLGFTTLTGGIKYRFQ